MALSVPPAPLARARAARSTIPDRRTGGKLLIAFVLARASLLVLTGRASANAVCGGHDRRRVEHGCEVGRRVDVVLAGSTDAVTGQRCFLVIGQDDDVAAFVAARKAVTEGAATASTPTDDGPPTVLPQESTAVRDHIGSPDSPVQAGERRLLGVRRAGSAAATQTMSSTLVVAGLIGLLAVCGAAGSIVHGVTGPVHRAVRVLQAPDEGRRWHRLRLTSPHVVTDGDDTFGAARGIEADARTLSIASEGPTATSGPPSSSAEELPVTRRHESVPETRSAVTVIRNVVQQARLVALDATIESVRSGGADTGFAVIAPRGKEPAEEAARAAEAMVPASTPAAGSVAITRYAAARSRALGPTTALWHAVELDRLVGAMGSACETTVCGSLVRVSTEQRWPVPARDVCPACSALAH